MIAAATAFTRAGYSLPNTCSCFNRLAFIQPIERTTLSPLAKFSKRNHFSDMQKNIANENPPHLPRRQAYQGPYAEVVQAWVEQAKEDPKTILGEITEHELALKDDPDPDFGYALSFTKREIEAIHSGAAFGNYWNLEGFTAGESSGPYIAA